MNIQKTNKLGLALAQNGFKKTSFLLDKISKGREIKQDGSLGLTIRSDLFSYNPKSKILRVSKSIMEASKLINIDSIKENINELNFDFTSMFILLDNDKSGVIRVERYGSDFSFIMMNNLGLNTGDFQCLYNSYSFITKSFYFEKEDDSKEVKEANGTKDIVDYDKSVFVVQLLTYLVFGEITQKNIPPKIKASIGSTTFLNNSKSNITFCDNLWKQRINVDGFKVTGHFRLQPCGQERKKKKLIWIEEFEKNGYNRKATVELQ